ncbi:MAG: hypothetical protein LBS25_06405 [Candidatus Symbiothrix sp.]|jgi:hypothetical protein|nr:hypothetical protein [Candidatus Symbiothrix sp.]
MNKQFLAALLLGFAVWSNGFAQNNNSLSPYTRYGYGKLADLAPASLQGMGGIAYGVRSPQILNSVNPAAVSAVDSMTFMFDVGLKLQAAWFNDQGKRSSKTVGGLEYVALQFSVSRSFGIGIGFEPLSYIGYQYGGEQESLLGYDSYNGSGGFSRIYANLGYEIWKKRLSLGVKGAWMFGDKIHNRVYTPSESTADILSWPDSLHATGFMYEIGLQYSLPLSKKDELIVGLVYKPKTPFSAKTIQYEAQTVVKRSDDTPFDMPESYGIGFTYNRLNTLTAGADFQYQKWADAQYYGTTDTLSNRMKINAGLEYIPNKNGQRFLGRVRYRLGGFYSDSYFIDSNGSKSNEIGVNVGLGIPMTDRRSFVNVAFEYSHLMQKSPLSMSENYFKLTVSYTFNESWFHKRKLQ